MRYNIFGHFHLGREGGGGPQPSSPRGGGFGGTHHAMQVDVISQITCDQKEELEACTCLYSCLPFHYGILAQPPPPPPREQKDRNSENITFVILRMWAVITQFIKDNYIIIFFSPIYPFLINKD